MSILMRRTATGEIVPMTEAEIAALQPTLDARRTSRAAAVDDALARRLIRYPHDFGAPHGVLHLQLRDAEDRTNWLVLRTSAGELVAAGLGDMLLPLRTEENIVVTLPASEVALVMRQMAAWGAALLAHSWALKDAIRVSDDPESIDIEAGWLG